MSNKYVWIYYAILILLLIFSGGATEPPLIMRLLYLIAVFLPPLIKKIELFPICVCCFYSIGVNLNQYGLMPYETKIYVIITLLALIFLGRRKTNKSIVPFRINLIFFSLALVTAFVNICNGDEIPKLVYTLLLLCLFGNFLQTRQNTIDLFALSFSIISFALSVKYFLNYDNYLTDYVGGGGFERSGWTDPNYLSCVIGMGVLMSTWYILRQHSQSFPLLLFHACVCVVGFTAQVVMASRGGLLAVGVALMTLLFTQKISVKYKICFLLIFTIFGIFLMQSGYFDLLQYRIQTDSGTGSGRTVIWARKIQAYLSESNFFQFLFGIGQSKGLGLGYFGHVDTYSFGRAFHNDFVAFLCSYGLLGLISLLALFAFPIFKAIKSNQGIVISSLIYLGLCSSTLEPLFFGRVTFWLFYYLICLMALTRDNLNSRFFYKSSTFSKC